MPEPAKREKKINANLMGSAIVPDSPQISKSSTDSRVGDYESQVGKKPFSAEVADIDRPRELLTDNCCPVLSSEMQSYYAARASEYERSYLKPERQTDLRAIEQWLPLKFAGARVIEVACGTGYWTQFIAPVASHVLALDAAPETIGIAKTRVPEGKVEFLVKWRHNMTSAVETFTPPNTPAPIGPYNHIAKVGSFVSIGGTAGVNPATGQLAGPDAYSQAKQILESFRVMLESVGSDLNHIVHVNVFLKSMQDFEEINRAYVEKMGNHRPARTVIGVNELPKPGVLVTMNLTAVTKKYAVAPIGSNTIIRST
jgi:2-iminobutanoate/2-iminopropanoate deaminase